MEPLNDLFVEGKEEEEVNEEEEGKKQEAENKKKGEEEIDERGEDRRRDERNEKENSYLPLQILSLLSSESSFPKMEFKLPIFCINVLSDQSHILIGGGGGDSKTGVPNEIVK